MEETLIWVGGLIIEALLVITVVVALLLRRSRKAQQQLMAQLAGKETHSADAAVLAVEAREPEALAVERESAAIAPIAADEPAKAPNASITGEFDELREIIDNAKLDESANRLQQRLNATTQSLQHLAIDLDQESIEPLQHSLQEMTSEVDSLQQNNAQLQQDLRNKTQAMEKSIAAEHENTDRVLQQANKLREDMSVLRDKLKNRESDVQQLQTANETLAAEYAALNKEYERIYASAPK